MSIKYALKVQKNPRTQQKKAYAYAVNDDSKTFRDVMRSIEEATTATTTDIAGVVESLIKQIINRLKEGEIVHVGDLGSFYTTLRSEGALKAENFNAAMIRKVNVRFRPGSLLTGEVAADKCSFVQTIGKEVAHSAAKAAKETAAANIQTNNEALGLDDGE